MIRVFELKNGARLLVRHDDLRFVKESYPDPIFPGEPAESVIKSLRAMADAIADVVAEDARK